MADGDESVLSATPSMLAMGQLVTAIDYRRQIVFIKWLGLHGDYDRIDARTVQYGD